MADSSRVAALQALFEDGGRSLLRDAGESSWSTALEVLEGELNPDSTELDMLIALRDQWDADGLDLAASRMAAAVVQLARHTHGEGALRSLVHVARLGQLLSGARQEEGAALIERAWEACAELAPPGDEARARVGVIFGSLRIDQERSSEAVFSLREASSVLEATHPDEAAEANFLLGVAMTSFGSVEEGIRRIEASVRHARQGPPSPALPQRLSALAQLLMPRRPLKDSEALFRESLDAAIWVHGEHSPEAGERHAALGALLIRMPGRMTEALGTMDVAVSLLLGSVGGQDPRTRSVASELYERLMVVGKAALEQRDRALAAECLSRAETVARAVFGPVDGRVARVMELAQRL